MKRICGTCAAFDNTGCMLHPPVDQPSKEYPRLMPTPGLYPQVSAKQRGCGSWTPRERGTCGDCEFCDGNFMCHHTAYVDATFSRRELDNSMPADWWCEHWMPAKEKA